MESSRSPDPANKKTSAPPPPGMELVADHKQLPAVAKSPRLDFLDGCTDEELRALQEKFGKTPEALDQLIKHGATNYGKFRVANTTLFQLRRALDVIAIWGANGLYLYYRTQTGSSGIIAGLNVYVPGVTVSDAIANGISGTCSIGTLTYILFSSAKKNAARTTLTEALLKDPATQLEKFRIELFDKSPRNFTNAFMYLGSKSVIYTANITSALSTVYAFRKQLSALPNGIKWPLTFGILGFTDRFNEIFMNDKFYYGQRFWLEQQLAAEYPWMALELRKKGKVSNPLILFEALVQLIGVTLLRSYPNYFLLNEFALSYFPAWLDSRLVAAIVGVHTVSTYWPTSYKRLFGAALEIYKRLLPTIDQAAVERELQTLLQATPRATAEEMTKLRQSLIDKAVQTKKDVLAKDISESRVIKHEPSVVLTTGIRVLTGVYVGATVVAGSQSAIARGFSGFAFGVIFGGVLYLAESERVRNNIILKLLKEAEQKATPGSQPTTKQFGLIEFGSGVIVFLNVASSTFGTAGSLALLGVTSPTLISLFTLFALGSATVSATYSYQPVVETSTALVNSLLQACQSKASVTPTASSNIATHDVPGDWVEVTNKPAIEMAALGKPSATAHAGGNRIFDAKAAEVASPSAGAEIDDDYELVDNKGDTQSTRVP